MPTYTYQCSAGVEFDIEQRITDPKLTHCPVCDRDPPFCEPKRLITGAPLVHLIAGDSGGWSESGYAKKEHERKAEQTLGRKLVKAAR
jgi:putative FmdB family regulatory protein